MTAPSCLPSFGMGEAVRRPERDPADWVGRARPVLRAVESVEGQADARITKVDLDRGTDGMTSPSVVASSVRLKLASIRFAQGRIDEALEQTEEVLATPHLPTILYS